LFFFAELISGPSDFVRVYIDRLEVGKELLGVSETLSFHFLNIGGDEELGLRFYPTINIVELSKGGSNRVPIDADLSSSL